MRKNLGLHYMQMGFIASLWLLNPVQSIEIPHECILKAEKLYEETLFEDAYPLYEQAIFFSPESIHTPNLIMHLTNCYMQLHQFDKIISFLTSLPQFTSQYAEINRCLAIAYRQTSQYNQALLQLNSFQTNNNPISIEYTFEKGLNLFSLQQLTEAYSTFQSIPYTTEKSDIYYLAQLYLSRLLFLHGDYQKAQKLLALLKDTPVHNPKVQQEYFYLNGLAAFHLNNPSQAIEYFEKTLSSPCDINCPWYQDTLYQLSVSYLNKIHSSELDKNEIHLLLNRAEQAIQKRLAFSSDEKSYLVLAQLYLARAQYLKDEFSYQMAHDLLSQESFLTSQDGKNQAILLLASSTPSHKEKQKRYAQILLREETSNPLYAEIIYLQGISSYEQALLAKGHERDSLFEIAAEYFSKAATLLEQIHSNQTNDAMTYQALSYAQHSRQEQRKRAFTTLKQWIHEKSSNLSERTYYLAALIVNDLLKIEPSITSEEVENFLVQGLSISKNEKEKETIIKSLSLLYLEHQKWDQADEYLNRFITDYCTSDDWGEMRYWHAKCAEKKGENDLAKKYFKEVYTQSHDSVYAPFAYFDYYSFRDYMHGSRKAIKHLETMAQFFPKHPLLISAYYLVGLDHKKDRLTAENRMQKHKNLTAAIDAFQQAESLFDSLYRENNIPAEKLFYFTQIRYRAHLDRALTNYAIANDSQGSKRHIYLEYATDVLKHIRTHFQKPTPPIDLLLSQDSYPNLWEETDFHLAQVLLQKGEEEEANKVFDEMLIAYQTKQIKVGYFLSRLWYNKAKIAQKHQDFEKALTYYDKAEKTCTHLGSEEKLDLWIEQSHCYKGMYQPEDSMRILSKVVNDESISGLRLKAMFLRAEIYELQGKSELAQRQLEALSKKGGEWSLQAKTKLEQYRLP